MPKTEKVKVKDRVSDNVCDLSLSELYEVPTKEIASFKRVTVLDLSSNRLVTLGKTFSSLTKLVKIDMSNNQLKFLPDDFGLLRNLRHLDLYDNYLTELPLSFGNLSNLRYLDLKGNPLMPALAKIVGLCLTTKECQDSAKNTVKFLSRMQSEAEKTKQQFHTNNVNSTNEEKPESTNVGEEKLQPKSKKSLKKSKSKIKKLNINNNNNINNNENDISTNITKEANEPLTSTNNGNNKATKIKNKPKKFSSTALTSILTFFFLLGINILAIYIIMFKNPEIGEKLTEFIPHQYRIWFLAKTEFLRLRVTDWISEFRTPPEEH